MVNDLRSLVLRRVETLPKGLQNHIYRVEKIAAQLAGCHRVNQDQAELAMLCHDVARAMDDDDLIHWASQFGLPVSLIDRQVPLLLHGPVGAEILKAEDGLSDGSIYQAVYWHSSGHPLLDQLGKIVFLADKLDPQKIIYYPYQLRIRELASEDLDRAVLEFLSQELAARANRGELVHPVAVETRNALLVALGGGLESER